MAFKKGQSGNPKGRPRGTGTRPQIRDYFTDEDVEQVAEMLKTHMVDDMNLLKFVAEQLFGKAAQQMEISGPEGEPLAANLSSSDRQAIDSLRDLLKQRAA